MSRGPIGQPSRQKATKRVLPLLQGAFNIKTRATAEAWGKNRHSYKPLPTRFRRDGFEYRQIARERDAAIYEQTWSGCPEPSVCYEVIRIRRHDGFQVNGRFVEPAEIYPKAEAWGVDGFSLTNRDAAFAALHFADAEGSLSDVGVAAALGAGVNLRREDIEKISGRRVRIFGDADTAGQETASRVGKQLVAAANEVQIFSLAGLHCQNRSLVKDLFDLSRIDCDDFEANRDLWSVTDLNSKGKRVSVLTNEHEFSFSPLLLPHVSPEVHGFPVYPVSSSQELRKELEELALRSACTKRDTARPRRWQLNRDLKAVEKRIARELNPEELIPTFDKWYSISRPYLDPKKTRDDYLAKFLAELGKVRVPTGEGEALRKALEHVFTLSVAALPILPGIVEAPESWRRLAALHCELARQSANGTYFLSCRDAAKANEGLNKDSANNIHHAIVRLRVVHLA